MSETVPIPEPTRFNPRIAALLNPHKLQTPQIRFLTEALKVPQPEYAHPEIKKLLAYAEARKPLGIINAISSKNEELISDFFVSEAQKFENDGNKQKAYSVLKVGEQYAEKIAMPETKTRRQLTYMRAYHRLGYADDVSRLIGQTQFDLRYSPSSVSATDLVQVASAYRDVGHPNRAATLLKRAIHNARTFEQDGHKGDFVVELIRQGYTKEANRFIYRFGKLGIKDPEILQQVAYEFADKNEFQSAEKLIQRGKLISDEAHVFVENIAVRLLERGGIHMAYEFLKKTPFKEYPFSETPSSFMLEQFSTLFTYMQTHRSAIFAMDEQNLCADVIELINWQNFSPEIRLQKLRELYGAVIKSPDINSRINNQLDVSAELLRRGDTDIPTQSVSEIRESLATISDNKLRSECTLKLAKIHHRLKHDAEAVTLLAEIDGWTKELPADQRIKFLTEIGRQCHLLAQTPERDKALGEIYELLPQTHDVTLLEDAAVMLVTVGNIEQALEVMIRIPNTVAKVNVIEALIQTGNVNYALQNPISVDIISKRTWLNNKIIDWYIVNDRLPDALSHFDLLDGDYKESVCRYLIKNNHLQEIQVFIDQIQDWKSLAKIAQVCVETRNLPLCMEVSDRLNIEHKIGVFSEFMHEGMTAEGLSFLEALPPSEVDAHSQTICKILLSNNQPETAHTYISRIDDKKKQFAMRVDLKELRIAQLLPQYHAQVNAFEKMHGTRGINFTKILESLKQSGQMPDEKMLEALVWSGADRKTLDDFLNLLPSEGRKTWSQKYRPDSGYFMAQHFEGILGEETRTFLQEADIPFDALAHDWDNSYKEYTFRSRIANIESTQSLERLRPGLVKTLYTDKAYFISNFARYPEELLIDIFDLRNTDIPYGDLLISKHDYNGSFYHVSDELKEFYQQIKKKGILLRISEAGNRFGVGRRILELDKRYGNKNKINFIIAAAHGSESQRIWYGETMADTMSSEDFQTLTALKLRDVIKPFVDKMPWGFISCHAGLENGLVHAASTAFGGESVGSSLATNIKSMKAVFEEEVIVKLEFEYKKGISQQYSAGKSISN